MLRADRAECVPSVAPYRGLKPASASWRRRSQTADHMTSASGRPEYQTDLLANRMTVPWSMRLTSCASATASSDVGKSIGMVIGWLAALAMGSLHGWG